MKSYPELSLCSLKHAIIYSSNWFFPLFKDWNQIDFLAGLRSPAKTITVLQKYVLGMEYFKVFYEIENKYILCPPLESKILFIPFCN